MWGVLSIDVIGILLAPYEEEAKKFDGWSKALAGFLGGVTLTKLENVIRSISDKHGDMLLDIIVARRFIIGGVCLILASIVTFVFRSYAIADTPKITLK